MYSTASDSNNSEDGSESSSDENGFDMDLDGNIQNNSNDEGNQLQAKHSFSYVKLFALILFC